MWYSVVLSKRSTVVPMEDQVYPNQVHTVINLQNKYQSIETKVMDDASTARIKVPTRLDPVLHQGLSAWFVGSILKSMLRDSIFMIRESPDARIQQQTHPLVWSRQKEGGTRLYMIHVELLLLHSFL